MLEFDCWKGVRAVRRMIGMSRASSFPNIFWLYQTKLFKHVKQKLKIPIYVYLGIFIQSFILTNLISLKVKPLRYLIIALTHRFACLLIEQKLCVVNVSSIQCILTHPVRHFFSSEALNLRNIWITKDPIQHLHSLTWIQFLLACLYLSGSSLRRWTKNNPVIKFYHLLKVRLRHKQSRCHAWFVTHWGQSENPEKRQHMREMQHDCTTQGFLISKINTYHFPKGLVDSVISIFYFDKRFMKKLSAAHIDLKTRHSAWIFMSIPADQKGLILRCWPSRPRLPSH